MTTPTQKSAELPEALPRYREYMHLRTTGAWSDGVPAWARDYSGLMDYMTVAHAVIEELHAQVAARAAAPQPPADVVRVCPECDIAGCRHMRATPAVAQEPTEIPEEIERTAPQPAPAPVSDDTKRLDWLLLHISGAEFRRIGVHYSGNASRADVDAARKQGANHD